MRTLRDIRWCALAAALAIFTHLSTLAATFGDVDITIEAETGTDSVHGYAAYDAVITNNSTTQTRNVRISFPDRSFSTGTDHITAITRATSVGPGTTVRLTFLQPPLPVSGNGVAVYIDNSRQRNDPTLAIPFEHMSSASSSYSGYGYSGSGGTYDIRLFMSRAINKSDLEASYQRSVGSASSSSAYSPALTTYGGQALFSQSSRDIAAWPETWLAYSRFDGVLLTADEFTRASPLTRAALRSYTEAGGNLIVTGNFSPPPDWNAGETTIAPQPGSDNYTIHELAFGQIHAVSQSRVNNWANRQWDRIRRSLQETRTPFAASRDVNSANRTFPVVEQLGVPVRGLFALIILFAILIGPVNLVMLSRMKKRMWLLWTVPAISVVFCAAIVTYAFLAEGWTSFSRTQLVTFLDQPNRRAATLGWTAYYAPIAPGGGLHFPIDTELTPQVSLDYGNSGRGRTINWSTDQHLQSGWISSRIPSHFVLRRAHTERQRVEFRPDADGKWTATNGLNVEIENLVFADPDGKLHRASLIPPGARSRLEPDVVELKPSASAPRNPRAIFQSDWLEIIDRKDLQPTAPGNYIATTTAAAFLDPGIEGTEVKQAPSLIFGVTEHARP